MAQAMAAKVRSRRGAQGATVGFGVVLFFDDDFNALTVGNVMRPLTDRFRISREKLAYLVRLNLRTDFAAGSHFHVGGLCYGADPVPSMRS